MSERCGAKLSIVQAMDEMLDNTRLEQLKVLHICERAGVSRTTFYSHFKDVYDVANWLWDCLMSDTLYAIGVSLSFEEGTRRSYEALLEHKHFFVNVFESKDYNGPYEYGARCVGATLLRTLERNLGRRLSDEELLMMEFRNLGCAGITKQWVLAGMTWDIGLVTSACVKCTPAFILRGLEPNQTHLQG